MYWLVLSTLFWSATYGNYPSKEACETASRNAPLYVSATCIPLPPTEPPH